MNVNENKIINDNNASIILFNKTLLIKLSNRLRDEGIKQFCLENIPKAKELLEKTVNLKVDHFYALWNLAILNVVIGSLTKAVQYYKTAILICPESLSSALHQEKAICYMHMNDFEEAFCILSDVAESKFRNLCRAICLFFMGNREWSKEITFSLKSTGYTSDLFKKFLRFMNKKNKKLESKNVIPNLRTEPVMVGEGINVKR